MIIQHNMLAMNNLIVGTQLQKGKAKNMERLASGYHINRAADDAANMAISEKMTSRIRALARCQQNIEEGISLTQTADGALNEVNNMLNRVNELCVQAANDTNTTDDRSKIAAEITQIYDDMDRIFETTEFNTMKIFRHDGDNYYGPEAEYLYHESVTELPPGDLHNWGAAMFPTKQFDLAKGATAATATMTLKNGVNLSDSSTLNGTSFFIKKGSTTYNVQFGTAQSSGLTGKNLYVNTGSYKTVSSAFQYIKNHSTFTNIINDVKINGNQVTFTFAMSEQTNVITADGGTSIERVPNGATGNGYTISFSGNTLNPIDSILDSTSLSFDSTATKTLKVFGDAPAPSELFTGPDKATKLAEFQENLRVNKLRLYPEGISIEFDDALINSIDTVGKLRQAIADSINNPQNNPNGTFEAIYDSTTGIIQINAKGISTNDATFIYIGEDTSQIDNQTITTNTVPLDITSVFAPNAESKSTHIIKIDPLANNQMYALNLNGNRYLITPKDSYPGYTVYSSGHNTQTSTNARDTVINLIRKVYEKDYDITMNADGNVVLTSKALNDNRSLNIDTTHTTTATAIKYSKSCLQMNSGYFTHGYSVSLDFNESLGNSLDFDRLHEKGFMLNNKYYQFVNPDVSSTLYNNSTIPISTKTITSTSELCNAISKAINNSNVTVNEVPANSGIIVIHTERPGYSDKDNLFSDGGPSGTFINSAVSSGGTAYKNPQAEIDFSLYDMDNLDELYGTGFRITCATCPGEFINVMFCHDKSELNYPASFNYTDNAGNNRTIHNYMVELKDVTHGSQIAANIAEQLKDDLDHFTEVKVSDTNSAILIAQDKRSADQQTGRGQVLAGVYTNFLYNVIPEKLPNLGDKVGGGRKDTDAYYAYCMIYAGDTKEKPYVPVHLPHFSVENLKLEYPGEPWDTYEKITDVMNRSKNAAEVVSMARSKIGADQNRLEHAFDYAANAEEQITDAMSRIKDTDMAEAVTTQAKLTILSNTQEAMLSQIVDLPERILPLLQQ